MELNFVIRYDNNNNNIKICYYLFKKNIFQVSHVECVTRDVAYDFVEDDTTHG